MAGSELAPNGVSPLEAEIGLGLDALHGALLAGLHGAVTQVVLPADRTAPTAARTVVGLCLGASLDARVLSDAQLLVSELVTNCLVHGALGDQDAIVIRLQLEAASLRLVVHHRRHGRLRRRRHRSRQRLRPGARGPLEPAVGRHAA